MKKLIFAFMIVLAMNTNTAQADSNTENYVQLVNTSVAELDAITSPKEEASLKTTLFNGLTTGYIVPSLNNEIKLKEGLSLLLSNIENYKVENSFLNDYHKSFVSDVDSLIQLLEVSIEEKQELVNSGNRLMSCYYVLADENNNLNPINDKIESINKTYKKINKF